jgi:hypothetical protein
MAKRKYNPDTLAKAFLLAAELHEKMLAVGFTDNGGAIHSAERIMNLLGLALNHANLSHINSLKLDESAECSEAAYLARKRGKPVFIEHVAPLRHLTRNAIEHLKGVDESEKPEALKLFVKGHYRLVLLTGPETERLNKMNRSEMVADRLEKAGVKVRKPKASSR